MPAFVLGCHRSGTSLLAGILRSALGEAKSRLGSDIQPSADNRKGHAETETLMHLNEHLLSIAGSSWHQPFIARPDWEEPETLNYLNRLRNRLDAHMSADLWVDKDPRLCLTRDAIAHILLADVPAVAIMRHPFEVAKSLYLRNGFPVAKGLLIWYLYNIHLYNCCSPPPSFTVLHHDLVSPEPGFRATISEHLQLFFTLAFPNHPPVAPLASCIHESLEPTLLHCTAVDPEQLGLDKASSNLFTALWQQVNSEIRQHPQRPLSASFSSALPEVLACLSPHHRTPVYGHHIEHERQCLEQWLASSQAHAKELEQDLQEIRQSIGYRLSQRLLRFRRGLTRFPRHG